jgi:hypothetical protein
MYTPHRVVPYGLITFGVIYVTKPDIFYMSMGKGNATSPRPPMSGQNKLFMRVLGMALIVAGLAILLGSSGG